MADPENFLSRWSRRKLEPEPEPAEPKLVDDAAPPPAAAEASGIETDEPHELKKEQEAEEPVFDISTLPSIESITAQTDIRVFMQKGVPAALTRAALRSAWIADPSIRDFKEIAENQWDFATGSDLPGFGPLDASAEDLRRMVADVFGSGPKPAAEAEPTTPDQPKPDGEADQSQASAGAPEPAQDVTGSETEETQAKDVSADTSEDIVHRNNVDVAMQQDEASSEPGTLPARRPHGRALPQ